jgi:tetratricopeptide (TPR) repeat protein
MTEPTEADEIRYRMLEPVGQFAREKLGESGETEAVRRRHAAFFLTLAEEAEPELMGPEQTKWLERLETEHDNLRVALSWALEKGKAELGLRLGGSLGEFWFLRGHLEEGRRWLEAVLAEGEAPESARARPLGRAAWIAWEQGDYERSVALSEECVALSRKLGDETEVAFALYALGMAELNRNELERAQALLEEAATLERASGDTADVARVLSVLGLVAVVSHDHERAITLHREGLALARRTEDELAIGLSLRMGALAYSDRGTIGERMRSRRKASNGPGDRGPYTKSVTTCMLRRCWPVHKGGLFARPGCGGRRWPCAKASAPASCPSKATITGPTSPPRARNWTSLRGRRVGRKAGR